MYIGGSIHSIRLPHRFKTSAFFFFFLFAWIVFSLFGTLLFVYRSVSLNVGFFSLWANVSQLVSHSAHGQRVRERDEKKIEERLWESERDSKLFGNGPETLWFHERDRQRWNNIYRIYIRYSQQRRNRQLPGLCVCVGNYRAAALWLTDWLPIFFFFFFFVWNMKNGGIIIIVVSSDANSSKKGFGRIAKILFFIQFQCVSRRVWRWYEVVNFKSEADVIIQPEVKRKRLSTVCLQCSCCVDL